MKAAFFLKNFARTPNRYLTENLNMLQRTYEHEATQNEANSYKRFCVGKSDFTHAKYVIGNKHRSHFECEYYNLQNIWKSMKTPYNTKIKLLQTTYSGRK